MSDVKKSFLEISKKSLETFGETFLVELFYVMLQAVDRRCSMK